MGEQLITSVTSVFVALVGLAIIATLVSNNAATSKVIQATTSGFASDLTAATNPFSGGGFGGNLSSLTGGGASFI